jgi:hypothetical protein
MTAITAMNARCLIHDIGVSPGASNSHATEFSDALESCTMLSSSAI